MQRWLIRLVILPLLVEAAATDAQTLKIESDRPSKSRTLDLRITQLYSFDPLPRAENGIIAEGIAPNARIGIGMVAVTTRRPGPNLRLDRNADRSRKPAVTLVWKF